jgi:undecaprenyl diphosphate synthase
MSNAPNLHVDEAVLKSYTGPIPRHVAVIMDGNGRWAEGRGMPRIKGHHEGANAVRRVVESCRYLGVGVLTLYAFSSQNWGRPVDEVTGLMTLFDIYIKRERKRLIENGVAMRMIGDRTRLSPRLQEAIGNLEDATSHNSNLILQVAVSYGGREEILHATRCIAEEVRAGALEPAAITEADFVKHLYTSAVPDPDLLIRTSGEMRISNFLLWQIAYSEIVVTDALWPDFDEKHFVAALDSFGSRQRRYGLTGAQAGVDKK